jgi:hypothetical protein
MNLCRGFVCEAFPGSVLGFALLRRKFGIEFKRHLVLEKPFLNLNPLKGTPVHGAHSNPPLVNSISIGAMCLPKFFAVSEFMIAASENFVLRSLRYHKGIRCESGTVPQR